MLYYIISKSNGKMLQYDGEIRYKIKKAIELARLLRIHGDDGIIVNTETGTQYSYLEVIK